MPYIAIKTFPKTDKQKQEMTEKLIKVFEEVWNIPVDGLSISIEDIDPADWVEKVRTPEIVSKQDKLMLFEGKKSY